jgi:hypothetical protein
LEGKF